MAGEASDITINNDKIVGTSGDVPVSTGGNISEITVGGERYRLHAFLTNGNFSISEEYPADVLVVTGGGSGGVGGDGTWEPGGGGAGGVLYIPSYLVSGTIPVTIGEGGAAVSGSYNARPGNKGKNSVFDNITAIGGGRGGAGSHDGGSGGSGGGGSHIGRGGSATQDQGHRGGDGSVSNRSASTTSNDGGGGGGAKEPGNTDSFASGGDGQYYGDIFGQTYGEGGYFGGGGVGGWRSPELSPTRGIGGGGYANRGVVNGGNAGPGQPNTGGGGGGATSDPDDANSASGEGGSGIVLVRIGPL